MQAGAGGRGVEDDAGDGVGAVGDFGALIGGERNGGVGVAGGSYGEVGGRESGTQFEGEGQGDIFLEDTIAKGCAGIGTAVGGVEEDEVVIEGGCGAQRAAARAWGSGSGAAGFGAARGGKRNRCGGRQDGEGDGSELAGGDQRSWVATS